MRVRTFAGIVALAAAWLAVGVAGAQDSTPVPPGPPGLSGLPPPEPTRLPGVDPRQCGTSKWSALCAMGRWSQFSRIEVRVKAGAFSGAYTIEHVGNGDLYATYREEAGGQRRGGEVLLIGDDGMAFRTRDPLPPAEFVIDQMLSNPLMLSQLVAVLLDQGVLGAPADVTKPQSVTASSATQFISTEAPRAATLYGPPWNMTGTVRATAEGPVAYALRLRFHPVDAKGTVIRNRTDAVELEGTVSYAPMRAALPPSFDLVGWKLMKRNDPLGPVQTLGEARNALGLPTP